MNQKELIYLREILGLLHEVSTCTAEYNAHLQQFDADRPMIEMEPLLYQMRARIDRIRQAHRKLADIYEFSLKSDFQAYVADLFAAVLQTAQMLETHGGVDYYDGSPLAIELLDGTMECFKKYEVFL